MLQVGLPSLEGKNKLFVGKKRKKQLANSSQTDYTHSNQRNHDHMDLYKEIDGVQEESICHFVTFLVLAGIIKPRYIQQRNFFRNIENSPNNVKQANSICETSIPH